MNYYPNCEGIDSDGESVFFVSKKILQVFELDLNSNMYTNDSTQRGLFDGKPGKFLSGMLTRPMVSSRCCLITFSFITLCWALQIKFNVFSKVEQAKTTNTIFSILQRKAAKMRVYMGVALMDVSSLYWRALRTKMKHLDLHLVQTGKFPSPKDGAIDASSDFCLAHVL